ncbi:MAG: tRNA epoxyqueuosine(34) reductase QueG [Anaerolineaceae bacterium]
MNTLLEQVKAYCSTLGFNQIGVTTPYDLKHYSIYEKWIASGCQADMHYLDSKHVLFQRKSPRNVMPSCQSILVFAYPYPAITITNQTEMTTPPFISGYAHMEDYHVLLPSLLEKVVHFIQAQSGDSIESRIFTDSGPLLERELGSQAGLGWIGKNSCLINKNFGSFFFLSEILLDIPLFAEGEDPGSSRDHCGTCQRCMDICPTHCIQENRTLDSRNCISYLTIENKEEIPLDMRAAIGDHLFGCDLCQQVCPWNQKAIASSSTAVLPQYLQNLNSSAILNENEFDQKFSSSPILRAKRSGFYRNLAVVLGNKGDPASIPLLLQLLRDSDTLIRQHAAWALGCFHSEFVRTHLKEALQVEENERVSQEIRFALA